MASKITETQYRSIILDRRPEEIIAKDYKVSKQYIRAIKKGTALKVFRERLDEYHRCMIDWQFKLELFVKARQKENNSKITEPYAEQFVKENPIPQKWFYIAKYKSSVAQR